MGFSSQEIDQKVLSSLSERTLVNGTPVATAPIAEDVGITPEELRLALNTLTENGWIETKASGEATITEEGHRHLN